jgi:hypothetical protein
MDTIPEGYVSGKETRLLTGFTMQKLQYWANHKKIRYIKDGNGRRC